MADRETPLVSVVVPVHGQARYLEHTLKSVVEQVHPAVELIVVDERAAPGLNARVASVAQMATVVTSNGTGPSAARNSGLAHASGRYAAFLDSDDVWLPGFLARLVGVLEKNPRYGVACSGFVQIDAGGGLVQRPLRRRFKEGFAVPAILIDSLIAPSTALCRRELVERVGGWPDRFQFEDRAFFVSLAKEADFVFVGEPLALYRIHSDNRTRVDQEGWLDGLVEVSRWALQGLSDRPDLGRLRGDLDAHIELMIGQMHGKAGASVRPLVAAARVLMKRPTWPEPYFLIARTILPRTLATSIRNRIDPPILDPALRDRIRAVLEPSWP